MTKVFQQSFKNQNKRFELLDETIVDYLCGVFEVQFYFLASGRPETCFRYLNSILFLLLFRKEIILTDIFLLFICLFIYLYLYLYKNQDPLFIKNESEVFEVVSPLLLESSCVKNDKEAEVSYSCVVIVFVFLHTNAIALIPVD